MSEPITLWNFRRLYEPPDWAAAPPCCRPKWRLLRGDPFCTPFADSTRGYFTYQYDRRPLPWWLRTARKIVGWTGPWFQCGCCKHLLPTFRQEVHIIFDCRIGMELEHEVWARIEERRR